MDRLMSRRSALASLGASVLPLAGGSNVLNGDSSSVSADHLYAEALNVRRQRDGLQSFWKSLSKKGFGYSVYKYSKSIERGEFSKSQLSENDFEFIITLTEYVSEPDAIYVDFTWKFPEIDYNFDSGEPPVDVAALRFASDDYTREVGFYDEGPFVCHPDGDPGCGTLSPSGVAVAYDDSGHTASFDYPEDYNDNGKITQSSWFSQKLLKDGQGDPENRLISFDYVHTYSNVEITSISVAAGGLAVSLSDNLKKWDKEGDIQEDNKVIECKPGNICPSPDP